jgi:perosamine synthetase
VLRLPPESEVLMSAVTIPDMVKIVEAHGLVPVAIDLDLSTLEPRADLLLRAVTQRTRVIVVSHVFGAIADMRPVCEVALAHGLLVCEDCAEAYCGPRYRGHELSDVSLFSFGTIKTETALGGALLRVRDAAVRESLRGALSRYPVQPLSVFAGRAAKYAAFAQVLNSSRAYGAFVAAAQAVNGTSGCEGEEGSSRARGKGVRFGCGLFRLTG